MAMILDKVVGNQPSNCLLRTRSDGDSVGMDMYLWWRLEGH
jgi:hypothetical protein